MAFLVALGESLAKVRLILEIHWSRERAQSSMMATRETTSIIVKTVPVSHNNKRAKIPKS